LLALLALRAGREIERDWLAALLWPESPPERATHSLRMSLKDLRQALGSQAYRLTSPTPRTLCLDLTGARVDLLAFDAAVASGDPAALRRAVGLYQGPLLEGCAEDWVVEARLAREQVCVAALEELAGRARQSGELGAAEGHLRRAIALDSLRESAQRALMEVLAARGSYTGALQVYRELRELLHREFNAEPDAETQALFTRLRADARRQARGSAIPGPMTHAPVTPDRRPHHLPEPPYPLVGRESELAAIGGLLESEDVRLVTLTGPGGSGKTRLSLQVAADRLALFREGVRFVDLAPLRDPALVGASIDQALGVSDTEGTPLTDRLKAYLRSKQLLLLLDNFEHVLAAGPLLAHLLAAAPQLKLLVTSRAVLGLRGEHEFPVAPLPPESAIELFVQRARALQSGFAATAVNAPVLAAICRRLEGLPLAIELAVGWLKLFSLPQLLSRLETRLPLLTGGPRDLPERQQTLRGTFAWSYDLLEEPEQRLLRRLSVFAGGFSLEAAEAVTCRAAGGACNLGGDLGREVMAGLAALVDKSLLWRQSGADPTAMETVRFSMLETIREFAQECLSANGEEAMIRRSHAEFFRRLAEQERRQPERLEAERGNLRAALGWLLESGDAERGLGLAEAQLWWWYQLGPIFEAREYLGRLLTLLTTPTLRAARVHILDIAKTLAYEQEDYAAARAFAEESLVLNQELGQREQVSLRHFQLARVASAQRDYERAHTHFQQSLIIGRELGEEDRVAQALYGLGRLAQAGGDLALAATFFRSSLEIFRKLGTTCSMGEARNQNTTYWMGEALVGLAIVTNALGDRMTVRALLEESLTLSV
jgi:predicted ATPase/DNA-binding SARP family transcriptional activator